MGNNSWIHPPFFSRHLVPHNVGNIIFGCYFLNIVFVIFSIFSQIQNGTSFRKINSGTTTAGTASKIQYLNIIQIKKKIKKTHKKTTNSFSNLDFLMKSGFPKILDLFMDFQGFPTPWISHPMDFGFSGRPRERPTKTKIGR